MDFMLIFIYNFIKFRSFDIFWWCFLRINKIIGFLKGSSLKRKGKKINVGL